MSSSVGLGFVMGLTDNVSGTAGKIGAAIVTLRTRIQALQTGFLVLGGALAGMGAALGGVLMKGVKDAAQFEVQMRMLQSITGLTWQETKQLGDEFDRITATLPMSSSELATMAIAAGKLGLASKAGVEGLKEVAIQATYMGKALGFSGEESINMIGRLGTVFGMLDAGNIYNSWEKSAQDFYDVAAMGAEKNNLVQAQMMHNVKGLAASLTQMSFASSQSADFLSDMSVRAAQGAKVMQKTAAETVALAGILADVGVRAEAGGTALNKFFTGFRKNMGGYEMMIKEFGADKLGLGFQELKDLTRDKPHEAVNRLLEAMGKAKFLDPVKFEAMADAMGMKNVRIANVVKGLADAGNTMVTVNAGMYESFLKLSPELASVAIDAGNGAKKISKLRWMQLMSTKAFDEASVAASAYNNVAQTTAMNWKIMTGSITNVSKKLGGMLLPSIQNLLQTAVNLMGKLFGMNDTFFKITAAVVGTTAAILALSGAVLLGASAWSMFGSAMMAALLPALVIVGAISAAVAGFVVVMKLLGKEGEGIFGTFARLVEGAFTQFLNFAQGFTEAWAAMSKHFLKPWNEAMSLFRQGIDNIKGVLPPLKGAKDMFQALGVVLATVFGSALRRVGKQVEWLSVMFSGFSLGFRMQVGDRLVAPIKSILKSLEQIGAAFFKIFVGLMPSGVRDLTKDFLKFRDKGKSVADKVVAAFEAIAGSLEVVVGLLNGEGPKAFKAFGKDGKYAANSYAEAILRLSKAYDGLFKKTKMLDAFRQLWADFLGGMKARAIPTLRGVLLLVAGIMEGLGKSGPALESGMAGIVSIMGSIGKAFLGVSKLTGKLTGVLGAFLGGAVSYLLPGFLDLWARVTTVIAGILAPVGTLLQALGEMPIQLEAFTALGEGVGKFLSGIGNVFGVLIERTGKQTKAFLEGFVQGFAAFIVPIGAALNEIAVMAGWVFGMIGDALNSVTGDSESTGAMLRTIGTIIGVVIGGAIQIMLLGVVTVIYALGNMINLWMLFINLAKAGTTVFTNGPRIFMATIDLLKAKLTNVFASLQVMMITLAAGLAKAVLVALKSIPGIGMLLDLKGASKQIDAMKAAGIESAQGGKVGRSEMAGLEETFRGATAETRNAVGEALGTFTEASSVGFDKWLTAGDNILNAQDRSADSTDRIASILAAGQTNVGEPKVVASPSPIISPTLTAAPTAAAAPVMDPAPIAAAISNVTVDPTIENTVNFTAQQSYVLHATAVFPGIANTMKAYERRLSAVERRSVVQGGGT